MRIFVTGASGHIGSALVPELLAAGDQVLGLARSDASADKLTIAGAEVVRGSIDDVDVLAEAGRESGGVIHLPSSPTWSMPATWKALRSRTERQSRPWARHWRAVTSRSSASAGR